MNKATFAAGCFWGVEDAFLKSHKILSSVVGYTGGHVSNPSYEQVCQGNTGHAEAVEVTYDPDKVSYKDLLDVFWTCHDPTTVDRQGADVGSQYRSAIFCHSSEQEATAKESLERHQEKIKRKIATGIEPMRAFFPAEEYHQKYYEKNPSRAFCHRIY